MILRMAAKTMLGAVAVAGAMATLAAGTAAVGGVLLAKRLCEERKGWKEGATAEPMPPEPGVPEAV